MDSIEIKGRKFLFKVPTPWDGCAIFNYLTSYDMPFGAAAVIGLESTKHPLSPEELEKLLKLCLKNCYEELTGGSAQVVDENGEVGIIDAGAPLLTPVATQYMVFFTDWWRGESI